MGEDVVPHGLKIWLVEPYYGGSHQAWADGYQAQSRHQVRLLTLPGRFWKWRMEGGAVTLARKALALGEEPDLVVASDMLNLSVFLTLTGERLARVPVALYFHENQLTYPLPEGEKRDLHYGMINFASALRADALFFNSAYHLEAFYDELPRLLKHFPDYNELWAVNRLRERSEVLPLGLDLRRLDAYRPELPDAGLPVLVWNHRWEYDKDPGTFFRAVYALADEGLDFRLILLGESFRNQPVEFLEARQRLPGHIAHFGYAEDLAQYARRLWQGDIVVSTAIHEFFGAAVLEACYCDCFPILPARLSYPELLPEPSHAACLYQDWDGLLARLRRAIVEIEATRAQSLRGHVAGYDWAQQAAVYDRRFALVAEQGGSTHRWP